VPEEHKPHLALESILTLTAFAAGCVDIITFAKLGGVLASAMTGNLAFLGYYLSRFSFASAFGSALALAGFVGGGALGTLVSRACGQHGALRRLLCLEALLLAGAVMLWVPTQHRNGSFSADAVIVMLAVSMGLQSIVGKRVNLSNIPTIVFTSTLTNIVIALTEMLARGSFAVPKDTKRQCASFVMYFLGALGAGFAAYFQAGILIALPLLAVGAAFVATFTLEEGM
jgi:uncharacterized membrane protein YoaK (UPF0700 family)